MSAVRTTIFLC